MNNIQILGLMVLIFAALLGTEAAVMVILYTTDNKRKNKKKSVEDNINLY